MTANFDWIRAGLSSDHAAILDICLTGVGRPCLVGLVSALKEAFELEIGVLGEVLLRDDQYYLIPEIFEKGEESDCSEEIHLSRDFLELFENNKLCFCFEPTSETFPSLCGVDTCEVAVVLPLNLPPESLDGQKGMLLLTGNIGRINDESVLDLLNLLQNRVSLELYLLLEHKKQVEFIGELKSSRQELQQKNSQLDELQSVLSESREQALAADRLKSIFLGKVSHELRTPMNGLLGMLELALDEEMTDKGLEYCNLAYQSGQYLLGLLDNLLDITKLEAGAIKENKSPFEIKKFLLEIEAIATSLSSYREKELELVFELPENVPRILMGDSDKLKQILLNVLENSFKYSLSHGGVVMCIEFQQINEDKVSLWFGISDCGQGIPESDLKRILDPFAQVDDSFTRTQRGVGLGLAIISDLIRLMGGKLSLMSLHRVGTRVEFELPFEVYDAKRHPEQKDFLPESISKLPEGLHVLVAEDNLINQRLISALLKKEGVNVTLAKDGQEAIDASRKERFDIILLDIQMPIYSGIDVLHMIRSERENANECTPCIAVTANAAKGDREKYLEFGMEDYLAKPFKQNELRDILEKYSPKK